MKDFKLTEKPNLDIFNHQFPAQLKEAEIYDPTKFTILTGSDGILDDLFSYQVYNKIKNHWRAAAAPADKQPGMIRSDSDDDKLHHYGNVGGAAWEEILQLTRSFDVSPQFATVRLMDTDASHYLELKWNEDDAANRFLDFEVNGANRVINLTGNPTLADWFDQSVKEADNVKFATVQVEQCRFMDTDRSHYLTVKWNEDDTINRFLDLQVNAANRIINLTGNSSLDQDYRVSATPSFQSLNLTNAVSVLQGGAKLSIEAGATGIFSQTILGDPSAVEANLRIDLATGQIYRGVISAKKYKTKIKDMELDSSRIYNLQLRSYNSLCKGDDKDKRFHGLIADEIEPYYPEMIQYGKNNEIESFSNQILMTLMLAETQHHEIKIADHETRIKALEDQLNN